MTEKQRMAAELFMQGYNCAQSVCGAFADELGISRETLLAAGAAFGGGFARTRNLCGAVSAIGLVISLAEGKSMPDDRGDVYRTVRAYTDRFASRFGSLNCGELLKNVGGITRTPDPDPRCEEYYAKRPCAAFVAEAAALLEEYFGC